MSQSSRLGELASKVLAVHEMLDSMGVPHQFGGAIALAWYRNPRATLDIDLNVTLAPEDAAPILGALTHLGVTISSADRKAIRRDGQVRLRWGTSYLDVFFATIDLHYEMARRSRLVQFGPLEIPILAPEHLVVCKAVFDRTKDWVDIESMVTWGTRFDVDEILRWVGAILGTGSPQYTHLQGIPWNNASAADRRARS